jgi:hypothetical protein
MWFELDLITEAEKDATASAAAPSSCDSKKEGRDLVGLERGPRQGFSCPLGSASFRPQFVSSTVLWPRRSLPATGAFHGGVMVK